MALAYNEGEKKAKNKIVVFLHQDLFLSEKWREDLSNQIEEIESLDPNWGAIGVLGFYIDSNNNFRHAGHGECKDYGWKNQVEKLPMKVDWIDSMVCVKKKGKLSFDNLVPFFHGAVEDLCEEALLEKMGVWVANVYTKHPSKLINRNLGQMAASATYLVNKWKKILAVGSIVVGPNEQVGKIKGLMPVGV